MAGKGKNAGQSKAAKERARKSAQLEAQVTRDLINDAQPSKPALMTEERAREIRAANPPDPKKEAAGLRKRAKALKEQAEHELGSFREGLIAKADMLLDEAGKLDPKPAKAPKAPKEARPTCNQLKKDGTPCTSKAMTGQTYCTDHRPGHLHLKEEERSTVAWWLDSITEAGGTTADVVACIVGVFGWGQVRQALKDGRIPAMPKAE